MLEWTGERFLPWIRQSTIAYEHLHRYMYAATLVRDKYVLDLACGEGYGSKILSAAAASVLGIDIDEKVIRHASEKYGCDHLRFISGSIAAVPIHDDHSFDVITCFEAIEHVEDQEALLREAKRLLKPDGLFIASTPNKAIYHDESSEQNPFHVKELYFEEFQELLIRHFHSIRFLGQRIHPGSSIWPIVASTDAGFHEFVMKRGSSEFETVGTEKRVPLYFIAIATDAASIPTPAGSVLLDESDSLIQETNDALRGTNEALKWREQQIAEREKTIESLEEAMKWRESQIADFTGQVRELTTGLEWSQNRAIELERTIGEREKTIASHEQALVWRAQQVSELEAAKSYWEHESASQTIQIQNTQRQLATATDTLSGIYASRGWKFIMKLRSIRDALKGLVKSHA